MKCLNCGKELKDEKFCPECGTPVANDTERVQAENVNNSTGSSDINANAPSPKPKKSSTLSNVLIIIGALLIAAVFLVYYFAKENSKNSSYDTSYSSSYSSSYVSRKPTEAPKLTVKEYYSVGETCTMEGIAATIDSCEIFNYDGYSKPKDGYVFIKVHAIVENNSSKNEMLGAVNFKCYADNQVIDSKFFLDDNYLSYDTVAPGRYISGYIYYEVPKDSDVELEYYSDWVLKEHKAIFKLKY